MAATCYGGKANGEPVDARLGLDALARTRVYVTASHDVRKLCPSSSSCFHVSTVKPYAIHPDIGGQL